MNQIYFLFSNCRLHVPDNRPKSSFIRTVSKEGGKLKAIDMSQFWIQGEEIVPARCVVVPSRNLNIELNKYVDCFFNRPGVAGAVLQTPLLLIN